MDESDPGYMEEEEGNDSDFVKDVDYKILSKRLSLST